MAAQGGTGERRRTRSLDERKRIVEEALGPAFVPVKLLELSAAPAAAPAEIGAKPAREARRAVRRGAMEISLPNGAKVSLDADVDAETLRRVLSALGVA